MTVRARRQPSLHSLLAFIFREKNLMFFAGLFRSVLEETVPSSAVPSSFYGQGRYSLGDSFLQYGVFIYILGLLLPSFTSVKVYMTRRFLYRSLLVPYM